MSRPGCCADGSCDSSTCMKLPDGKTCGDCRHLPRCRAFGVRARTEAASYEKECDYFPRRFLQVIPYPRPSVSWCKCSCLRNADGALMVDEQCVYHQDGGLAVADNRRP